MTDATAYLGLGSNMGDRVANLRRSLSLLAAVVVVEAVSSLYETAPWGYLEQPAFLNAACRVRTSLPPERLLQEALRIEAALGRRRSTTDAGQRWGPRPVDLDILFYDDLVMETADLSIPHPLLSERAFVLVPLAEIAPGLCHPLLGKTVAELLGRVGGRESVRTWGPSTEIWAGVPRGGVHDPGDCLPLS